MSRASAERLSAWKRHAFDLLKKPFFGRFARPWRWPAEARPEDYERFEVRNRDGGRLAGLLRRTRQPEAHAVLLLAHPMGVSAKGFFLKYGHVELFTNAGFHCVLFDFNGFGESESTSFDYPDDVRAVAAWAQQQFPELAMAALGASFGAMQVLGAAAEPDCPFRVLVVESVVSALPEFWKHYPAAHALLKLLTWLRPEAERQLRPEARIRDYAAGRSLLMIHSACDVYTPPSHGDRIAAAAPAHVAIERLILERSAHTHGLRDEPERYRPAVLAFLMRKLRAASPTIASHAAAS